jgi:phosphoglycerate kinase
MIKYLKELNKEDLNNKKILLRADFNVALKDETIAESFRIKAVKETIDYLVENGAKVMLVSHISEIESFEPIVEEIGFYLSQTLTLVPHSELKNVDRCFGTGPVLLLDNIRQDKREFTNDDDFAREIAEGFDIYVNDAFAVSHREQASVCAITKYLPSYAGLLMKRELDNLSEVVTAPKTGKTLILGGAKISTKLPVIKNFIGKADNILIGGAIANNFFHALGIEIGSSVFEPDSKISVEHDQLSLPVDMIISDDKSGRGKVETKQVESIESNQMILDIGPRTIENFLETIDKSSMVIWNGPMGLFETKEFSKGTEEIAKAVARRPKTIIGGGDTIAAVGTLGLLEKYSFVSTGGGAMLEFLAGRKLPALASLGYYE